MRLLQRCVLQLLHERTFSFTVAGLAANSRSTLVNGSMPRRFFFAAPAQQQFSADRKRERTSAFLVDDDRSWPRAQHHAFDDLRSAPVQQPGARSMSLRLNASLIGLIGRVLAAGFVRV